jgi:type II secretory pathway pseudopilin PulG
MVKKLFNGNFAKSGFTLVEVVMIIAVNTVMLLVISTSIVNLYQSNSYIMAQSHEIDQARLGLQSWLSDTEEMTYANDGTFPIAVMEPHHFGFYSDVDNESSVEYVEYELSSTTLYKYTYKSSGYPPVYNLVTPVKTEILSQYVQNLDQATSTFSYFDTDGNLLATSTALLTDIRYIEARVIVNIDPLRSPGEFLLRSGTAPRNLKDNL